MHVHCMQEVNAKLSKMKLQAKAKQAKEAKDAKEGKGGKSVSKKEATDAADEKVTCLYCQIYKPEPSSRLTKHGAQCELFIEESYDSM